MTEAIRRNRVRKPNPSGHSKTAPAKKRGQARRTAKSTPVVAAGLPMLRTSERGAFKRCRWKWHLEFVEHVKPKIDAPPLRFGTLYHQALAAYYIPGKKRGVFPARTFDLKYAKLLLDTVASTNFSADELETEFKWGEQYELGMDMLEAYVEEYGKDEEWEVIVTEHPFRTIVPHPRDGFTPWFWYVGVIDGVWKNRSTSRIVIPDHKTTAAIQARYLALDDQATAYWTWGIDALVRAGLLPPNNSVPIDGMLYNLQRKAKRDPRPTDEEGRSLNKDGSVSQKQPAKRFERKLIQRSWHERESARRRVLEEFADMEAVRREKAGHYKNPSQFTCVGCWAFDICELHEMGADHAEMQTYSTRTWDPYAEHEILEGR